MLNLDQARVWRTFSLLLGKIKIERISESLFSFFLASG
jgi:hypothetical protein